MAARVEASISMADAENAIVKKVVGKPLVVATKRPALRLVNTNDIVRKVDVAAAAAAAKDIKSQLEVKGECEAKVKDVEMQSLAYSCQMLAVEDVDSEDKGNPQLVSIYVNEIYEYLRQLERKVPIHPNFLRGKMITSHMRGILIDWLVLVALKFDLLQETLYLTVYIIDNYLQKFQISKNKLQLLGITAMFIAAKYEEMYAPPPSDFIYIADNAYTDSELRKMEVQVLKGVEFHFGRPLPLHFLRRYSKVGEVDVPTHTLAKYLMELSAVEYGTCHYLPSLIAAAALCLSMKLLCTAKWTPTLAHYSKYNEKELEHLMSKLACVALKASSGKLKAVHGKYESSKYMKISSIPELRGDKIKKISAVYLSSR